MRRAMGLGFGAVMCLLLLPTATSAQGTSAASIAGVVRDPSGGVLPGATVEVASPALIEKVRTTVTDAQGQYRIIELRSGTYTLTVTLPGFSTFKREGLELPPSFTATVNIELRVGALEETVNVSGATPLVDIQNLTQQKQISRALLDAVPTAKSMLGMAALMPAVVTPQNAEDVGGSKGEQSVRVSVHGGKTNDQRLLQDGMIYNHLTLEGTGRVGYINPLGADEIVIDVGTMGSAEYELGGAMVNAIPKDGGNRFSGTGFVAWMGHQLQSDNFTDDLKTQGLKSVNGVRSVYDNNVALGGPILKDRIWFFTAHRRWGVTRRVANLFRDASTNYLFVPDLNRPAEPTEADVDHGFRLTMQATPKNKFTFSYDWQKNLQEQLTGQLERGTLAVEANGAYCQYFYLTQGTWTYPASNKLLFSAGSTWVKSQWGSDLGQDIFMADWQTCLNGNPDKVSIVDNTRGFTYHGTGNRNIAKSNQMNGRFSVSYLTSAHQIKTGMFYQISTGTERYSARSPLDAGGLPVSYTFLNDAPTSLTEYASPLYIQSHLRPNLGLFVQDQWRMNRLTINAGLRFDYNRAYVPATTEAASPIMPARSFGPVENVPNWKDIDPRFGIVYDLFGHGKTALKVGINRYVNAATVGLAEMFAPASSSVNSTTRSWNDANRDFFPDCNLSIPAANGECGAMANASFGTYQASNNPDPNWVRGWGKRGYNWQTSVSIDHELMPGVAVRAGYFRTWFGNFTATDNLKVTPADYSPYCITAPTDSRLPASISGQSICGFYDINPNKFGLVDNVVTLASKYGKQAEIYNGADLTFNARLGRGAMLSGGWNIGTAIQTGLVSGGATQSRTDNCFVVDSPQQLHNCKSQNPYQQRLKLSGVLPLPWDLQVSAVFQSGPGANYGASYTATTAQIAPSLGRPLAGTVRSVTVDLLAPFSAFGPRINQLDARLSKKLTIGKARLQANFDLYNVMNASTPVAFINTIGNTWRQPTAILDARLAKMSVQLDF